MAKKSRAQRKQHGGQRSNRRKVQPQSQRSSRSTQSQPAVDGSASVVAAAPKTVSGPAGRTTKAASKIKTSNVKAVDWEREYSDVVSDLHMLMIVSIFLFIVIIGAGSFIT